MYTFIIVLTMRLSAWRNRVTKTNKSKPKEGGKKQSREIFLTLYCICID